MSKHRFSFLIKPFSVIADLLSLNIAYTLAFYIKFFTLEPIFDLPYSYLLIFMNTSWVALLLFSNPISESRISQNVYSLSFRFIRIVTIHLGIVAFFWINIKTVDFSRKHTFLTYIFLILIGILWRVVGLYALMQYRAAGKNLRKFAIIGKGELAHFIKSYYHHHPELGFQFEGLFKHKNISQLEEKVLSGELDYIYCCLPNSDSSTVSQIVNWGEKYPVKIKMLTDFRGFLLKSATLEYHDFIPVLSLGKKPYKDSQSESLKRAFDVCISIFAIILLAPVYLIVAIITKTTSSGAVLYSQERIGRWGKTFKIVKFRSMYENSETKGPQLSQGDVDNRITPWGRYMRKTRIDELPQFFNVLKGDMSLVGPRPERQFFIDQIVEKAPDYLRLLSVKPGITSLGQVHYGYASDVQQMIKRMKFDLIYLKKYSLKLDVYLLLATAKVIFQGKGQ